MTRFIKFISDGDGLTPEERERHAATRARISEIDGELFGASAYRSPNILSRNAGQLNATREQRFAALRRERESLLSTLPKTGEASGQHLVIAGAFMRGTTYVRESEPEPEVHMPVDEWDWSEP